MNKLILRDVRCFRGTHEVSFAPLTVLVGENSTGKSTLLALTRIAWDLAFSSNEPNFNEEPFHLGAYDELAHYHGGQGARVKSFQVGLQGTGSTRSRDSHDSTKITGTFSASNGQPVLSAICIEMGNQRINAEETPQGLEINIATPTGIYPMLLPIHKASQLESQPLSVRLLTNLLSFMSFGRPGPQSANPFQGKLPPDDELGRLSKALSRLRMQSARISRLGSRARTRSFYGRPLEMAPVRTRPKRTYDPLREIRTSEGDHVPMLLARLRTSDPKKWDALAEALSSYGRTAGLFDEVIVRSFSRSESSPFQIRVRLAGQRKEVNLIDVGYGVSQVLPILVDPLISEDPTIFLMQQPEVHLHPRAQAALGTLIASLVQERNHRFVIETHSDYFVDRVRLAVKDKVLPPNSVILQFLERQGAHVRIHKLSIDEQGNLIGQPAGYREFFLDEELRMISP